MLAAAFVAAVGSYYFGSPWLGLILAMIAVFIINRLRNVLGKKTGNENDIDAAITSAQYAFE